ncbi:MAG: DUF5655 domain-containing protein [Gaiellales bacterium]
MPSRIFGGLATGQGVEALASTRSADVKKTDQPAVPASGTGRRPAGEKHYPIEHHTQKMSAAIIDLFQQIDAFACSLGPDVGRRVRKWYIGYFVGQRSFFTLQLTKSKINAYLSLNRTEIQSWRDDEMRDVTNIGHMGLGDTAFALRQPEQLDRLEPLLKASYLRNRK